MQEKIQSDQAQDQAQSNTVQKKQKAPKKKMGQEHSYSSGIGNQSIAPSGLPNGYSPYSSPQSKQGAIQSKQGKQTPHISNQTREANDPQGQARMEAMKVARQTRNEDIKNGLIPAPKTLADEALSHEEIATHLPSKSSTSEGKPLHGVTLKAGKVKVVGQEKEVQVKADVEVSIEGVKANGYVCPVLINEKVNGEWKYGVPYRVLLPKAMVKVTPNQLDEIDKATRQQIIKDTNPKNANNLLKAAYDNNIPAPGFMHTPGIPKELRQVFVHLAGQFFSDMDATNRMMTFRVDFGQIPPDVAPKGSPISTKYEGKIWAYRFTSLRHSDFEKTILVEELGEVKQAPLTTEDETKVDALMNQYQLKIHQATAKEQANSKALKQALAQTKTSVFASNSTIAGLHSNAFLPFTPQEKTDICRALLKMTPAMLERIAGVEFYKRSFVAIKTSPPAGVVVQKTKDGRPISYIKIEQGWVAARYHADSHTVSVYEGMISPENALVFGDKGSEVFVNKTEQALIHELGHAVDFGESDIARKKRDQLKQKPLKPKYTSAPRLSGQTNPKRRVQETEFSKAAQLDAPLLTKYSKQNDLENFAEAFAVYVTEPQTLKLLSPHVYQYFVKHYPRSASDD